MVRSLKKVSFAFIATLSLLITAVIPPMPAYADLPVVLKTATITNTSANVTVTPLVGQSSCNVEIIGTAAGTTQGLIQGTWVNVNSVALPDGGTPSPTLPGAGSYTANCASLQGFRFVPTSVTGSATITIVSTSGVGRVIGAGVNGGKTTLIGTAPITVTNSGSTATVGLTTPLAVTYGGTGQTSFAAGCLQSNGTTISSSPCPSPTPVSVTAGTGIAVATPSAGVFSISNTGALSVASGSANVTVTQPTTGNYSIAVATPSPAPSYTAGTGISIVGSTIANTGVLGVTASGNLASSGGQSPNVTITSAPTFLNITDSGITSGQCVQASTGGLFVGTSCSSGTVTAVTGTAPIVSSGGTTPAISCPSCTLSVASGSANVTVAQPTTNNYTVAVSTPAPYTAGTGISIASNVVANTGVLGVTASGNLSSTGGQSPGISITATPTFTTTSTGTFNVTGISNLGTPGTYGDAGGSAGVLAFGNGSGVGNQTTYYSTSGNSVNNVAGVTGRFQHIGTNIAGLGLNLDSDGSVGISGNINVGAQAANSGKCVQFSTNGQLTAAAAACGSGNGTVTGLTAGSNIVVGTGATPSVAVTAAPTFAGNVTAAGFVGPAISTTGTTGVGLYNWSNTTNSDSYAILTSNSNSIQGVIGNAYNLYSTGSSTHIPNTSLVTVDYTGNVGVASNLIASNLRAASLSASQCVSTNSFGYFVSTGAACASKAVIFIPFGFYGGTVNTTIPYPYFQAPSFTTGQLTTLRVACATADNGTTVFTFKNITTSATIGTISMANAATTGTVTLGSPYSLVAGQVLSAVVTTAGTATSCGLTAEGTQVLQ